MADLSWISALINQGGGGGSGGVSDYDQLTKPACYQHCWYRYCNQLFGDWRL